MSHYLQQTYGGHLIVSEDQAWYRDTSGALFTRLAQLNQLASLDVGTTALAGYSRTQDFPEIDRFVGGLMHKIIAINYILQHERSHPQDTPSLNFWIPNANGYADLVSNMFARPETPGELWEIKPDSHRGDPEARQQLQRYLRADDNTVRAGRFVAGHSYFARREISLCGFDKWCPYMLVAAQGQGQDLGLIFYHIETRPLARIPEFSFGPEISLSYIKIWWAWLIAGIGIAIGIGVRVAPVVLFL